MARKTPTASSSNPKKPRAPRKPKAPPLTAEQKEVRRWEKAAEREALRARKKGPLLLAVGAVVLPSPEEKRRRHEAAKAQQEIDWARKEAEEEANAVEARAAFVAVATPEQLAAIDEKIEKYPRLLHPNVYRAALRELQGIPEPVPTYQTSLAAQKARRAEERAQGPRQTVFFAEELGLLPKPDAKGKPAVAVDDGPPPICPDCGWDRTLPSSKLSFNLHPDACPSRRGFMLGMSTNCAACKALRYGCCADCRAKVVECDEHGHLPHWPTKPEYIVAIGRPTCERCAVTLSMDALAPRAA